MRSDSKVVAASIFSSSTVIGHIQQVEYSAKGGFAREREIKREKERERERERERKREKERERERGVEKESLQSSIVSTRKGICRTGRVRDVHSRCVRLCERVFTTL